MRASFPGSYATVVSQVAIVSTTENPSTLNDTNPQKIDELSARHQPLHNTREDSCKSGHVTDANFRNSHDDSQAQQVSFSTPWPFMAKTVGISPSQMTTPDTVWKGTLSTGIKNPARTRAPPSQARKSVQEGDDISLSSDSDGHLRWRSLQSELKQAANLVDFVASFQKASKEDKEPYLPPGEPSAWVMELERVLASTHRMSDRNWMISIGRLLHGFAQFKGQNDWLDAALCRAATLLRDTRMPWLDEQALGSGFYGMKNLTPGNGTEALVGALTVHVRHAESMGPLAIGISLHGLQNLTPSPAVEAMLRAFARHIKNTRRIEGRNIAMAVYGMRNLTVSKGTEHVLLALSPHIHGRNQMNSQDVCNALHGLNRFTPSAGTETMLIALAPQFHDCTQLKAMELGMAFHGLKNLSASAGTKAVLIELEVHLRHSLPIASKHIGKVLYGLKSMTPGAAIEAVLLAMAKHINRASEFESQSICNALYGMNNLQSSEGVEAVLIALAKHLPRVRNVKSTEISMGLYGLRSLSPSEGAEAVLLRLAAHIPDSDQFGSQSIGNSLFGLRSLRACAGTEAVLIAIAKHISRAAQIDPQAIANALNGMRNLPSSAGTEAVLTALAQHIPGAFQLTPEEISMGLYGIQGFSASKGVDAILISLAAHIRRADQFNCRAIRDALHGLQNLTRSEGTEVTLTALAPHIPGAGRFDLPSVEMALYGMQNLQPSNATGLVLNELECCLQRLLPASRGPHFLPEIVNSLRLHFNCPAARRIVETVQSKMSLRDSNLLEERDAGELDASDSALLRLLPARAIGRVDLHGLSHSLARRYVSAVLSEAEQRKGDWIGTDGMLRIVHGRSTHREENAGKMKSIVALVCSERPFLANWTDEGCAILEPLISSRTTLADQTQRSASRRRKKPNIPRDEVATGTVGLTSAHSVEGFVGAQSASATEEGSTESGDPPTRDAGWSTAAKESAPVTALMGNAASRSDASPSRVRSHATVSSNDTVQTTIPVLDESPAKRGVVQDSLYELGALNGLHMERSLAQGLPADSWFSSITDRVLNFAYLAINAPLRAARSGWTNIAKWTRPG